MKFRVTMKDPDGPYECIEDAAKASLKAIGGLSESEQESLLANRVDEINKTTGKFLEYGEYITVEFDTEAGTCIVIPCKP